MSALTTGATVLGRAALVLCAAWLVIAAIAWISNVKARRSWPRERIEDYPRG